MNTHKGSTQPFSMQDRDLLIEHSVLLREIKSEIVDMRDGVRTQINNHEARIRKIEDLILEVNPMKRITEGDNLMSWVIDFRSRWKVYATIGLSVWSIITATVTALIIKKF